MNPRTGEPLDFIGQFPVPVEPEEEFRMAYLFLSYEDYETGGIDPEDGEAVLLVQPDGRIPEFATIGPAGTKGRSLFAFDEAYAKVPVEFRVETLPVPDQQERYLEQDGSFDVDNYMGGKPYYKNRAGVEAPWRFYFSLADGSDTGPPYFLNFGYGAGYAYLSADRLEGRFNWEAA